MTIYAVKPPILDAKYFDGSNYQNATLYVPDESVSLYANVTPWYAWGHILPISEKKPNTLDGTPCENPTINFENGKLRILSSTPGAQCYYTLTAEDCKNDVCVAGDIELAASYSIVAYAVAEGYAKSEMVYASLYWVDGKLNDDTNVKSITLESHPILVSSDNGVLHVNGLADNEIVDFYAMDGRKLGSTRAQGNVAVVSAPKNEVVIIKIAGHTLKVLVK